MDISTASQTAEKAANTVTNNSNTGDVVRAISQTIKSGDAVGTVKQLNGVWSRFYASLYKEAVAVWPHVLTGIFILIVFYIFARIVKFLIKRMGRRAKRRREIYLLLGKCAKVTINIIGVITALGTMGVDVTALITGLGLTGFAIGLALKDPISNAISGFMVLFYEPFKVGDKIEFSGNEGVVKQIQLRYTILTAEGKHFLIPNSNLLTNVITVNDEVIEPIKPKKSKKSKQKKKSRSRTSS
jgi:small conductance mechanosensitive channel